MASSRSIHPTLYEILKNVQPGKSTRQTAVDGLTPRTFQHREGVHVLNPEQLLSIRVPELTMVDGHLTGYQRHLDGYKARRAAEYIEKHADYLETLGVAEVSLTVINGKSYVFFTDGQHRAAGAVLKRKPLKILVTKRSEEQARRLFANQRYATKPPGHILILDGDDVFDRYIQDAITSPDDHPWNKLITMGKSSPTRLSAPSVKGMLRIYAGRSAHVGNAPGVNVEERFTKEAADHLAALISAFGTRQTNALAFKASNLRAIAIVARAIFQDRPEGYPYRKEDENRWNTHMTRFPFWAHASVSSGSELALRLKVHWNKGLRVDERKVPLS